MDFLKAALILVGAGWLAVGALLAWSVRGTPLLDAQKPAPALDRAPRVSIVVAARNEEASLPAALDSLLKLDYPDYEVILVDDDSTDRTGAMADEWAARPEAKGRMRVIHLNGVPAGWRGKIHALDQGARAATGDWVLTTDADVVFHPTLLRRAMALAREKKADLVSLFPWMKIGALAEKIVLPAYAILIATVYPARKVNDPASGKALAAGAFILMRRAELEALGRYQSVRSSVVEDLQTARMFKKGGRRVILAMTHDLFWTRMYHSWGELFEALSRTFFEGAGHSVARAFGMIIVGNAMGLLPWAAAVGLIIHNQFHGRSLVEGAAFGFAAAACGACALVYGAMVRYLGIPLIFVLILPVVAVFYTAAALHSVFASRFGSGVTWKGRSYRPSQ